VVSAIEQPGRHHVEWLKLLRDGAEDLLQMREHGPGKLIYQKGAVRIEHRMGGAQNRLSQLGRHRGIRNTRDHIIGPAELEPVQYRGSIRRGAMNDM